MQKHGTRSTGGPPSFPYTCTFPATTDPIKLWHLLPLIDRLLICASEKPKAFLKKQNVQLYLIRCHPSTKPCNTPILPTNIYHASPLPRRFQTPSAAFHWCTLAAPKASTPFKQHFDKHMANELRLCSIYVEYSSVVIIHHNFHHNSYISFYIFEHLLWHAQQNKKISQKNLNRFSSVWAPDLLRQSRLQRICLWTLWTVERLGRQLGETCVVVNFRGLHHLRKRDKLSCKPIHVSKLEKIGPDQPTIYVCFITSTCGNLWRFFSRKVHCFEFRAAASSAYWSSIKLATCSAPLNASTWITSSTTWDSDVPTCEAIKMQKKTKASVDVLAPQRCREMSRFWTYWNLLEGAGSLASVTPSLGHKNLFVDSSFALESI